MATALVGASGQTAPFDEEAHDRQLYPAADDTLNVYAGNGPYSSPIVLIRYKESLFASTSSALWFSADADTWTLRHRPPPLFLGSTDDYLYLFDAQGGLLESTDHNDYKQTPSPPGGVITAVASVNGDLYSANGSSTIFLAPSEPRVWKATAPIHLKDKFPYIAFDGKYLYALSTDSRQVFSMHPSEGTWAAAGSIPAEGGTIHQLISWDGNLYTIADHRIYVLDQKGPTWTALATSPNRVNLYSLVDFNGVHYVGSDRGLFALQTNGTWTLINSRLSRGPVQILNHVQDTEFASTSNGLFESPDRGKTWNQSDAPLDRGIVMNGVVEFKGRIFAASEHGLFTKASSDSRWIDISITNSKLEYTAICVDPSETLLVAVKGQSPQQTNPAIYQTKDGSTWSLGQAFPGTGKISRLRVVHGSTFALAASGVYRWSAEHSQWQREDTLGDRAVVNVVPFGPSGILALASDNLFVKMNVATGDQWQPATRPLGVGFDAWIDPIDNQVMIAAAGTGLYYTANGSPFTQWNFMSRPMTFNTALTIDHLGSSRVLLGTDFGVYIVEDRLPRASFITRAWHTAEAEWSKYEQEPWFWAVTTTLGAATTYGIAVLAIFLISWGGTARWLGIDWLFSLTAKPLTIFPRFLRGVLFFGYKKAVAVAITKEASWSRHYFGLPAMLPDGSTTKPDSSGATLDAALGKVFEHSNIVVVLGKGGSGKSTLLSHWAKLGISGQLPGNLRNLIPIHLSAADYQSDLVQGASETLRRRFGVPLDRKGDMLRQQMLAGGFLVLFDGLSEIEGEKKKSIDDILRTARDKDMHSCRFLFTTRPIRGIPPDVHAIELLPLNLGMIESIFLPSRTDLTPEQRDQVIRQLAIFRDDQIDPLLVALAIDDSSDPSISETTSGLFTRYFRRLLRAENSDQETTWQAWRFVLETFADWFMLGTGKRGVGLQHRQLVQRMTTYEGTGSLLSLMQAIYGISFSNENALLDHLAAARILEKGPRWRFQHDLFEEYFAAGRIVTLVEEGKPVVLGAWSGASLGDVANVIDFIKQFASPDVLNLLIKGALPKLWRDRLSEGDTTQPQKRAGV